MLLSLIRILRAEPAAHDDSTLSKDLPRKSYFCVLLVTNIIASKKPIKIKFQIKTCLREDMRYMRIGRVAGRVSPQVTDFTQYLVVLWYGVLLLPADSLKASINFYFQEFISRNIRRNLK